MLYVKTSSKKKKLTEKQKQADALWRSKLNKVLLHTKPSLTCANLSSKVKAQYRATLFDNLPSGNAPVTGGECCKTEPKQYTGDAMIGIATMHKSNSVPVFSKENAKDISKMRRG